MTPLSCAVLVLGGGPGGYVAAIRAGQLGLDNVLVESGRLGGTCLNVGCIPSKAMIHAADLFAETRHLANSSTIGIRVAEPTIDLAATTAWKDGIVSRLNGGVFSLLRRANVRVVPGTGFMQDGKTCRVESETGDTLITTEHVVIATGSEAVALPLLPFGGRVISSTEALSLAELPRHLVVVGAGYIGLELGITVHLGARAAGLDAAGKALKVERGNGQPLRIAADRFLVAVGRRARLEGWGLEELDLDMNGRAIAIDERCATSMRNVWAIGDVTGEPMLAHRAMAQGEMVAEIIAGRKRAFDKAAIAAICFTDPEVLSVGLSPDEARATGQQVRTGTFPFSANGRAMTMQAEQGFVRVVARADNHLVLGIQAVGSGVSELAAGFALALEMGACLEDIAGTVHAHPTRGEALHEATLRALGHALHV